MIHSDLSILKSFLHLRSLIKNKSNRTNVKF